MRAGDPDAFGQLFDERASVVYRHAIRLTGDGGMADDLPRHEHERAPGRRRRR
ncbi:hypothetical protein [Streptomyces sp. PSAA01]|uniref:hypothetical protein n=1 Tax=Streptomyces sp. PSAA01 TaxID=2912762 RepID=UPI0035ABC68F